MRLFITIIILCVFSCSVEKRELPIYGRSEIIETNNNGIISFDTINHTIKAFKFYNQDSILIDNNTFNNSIYIADFFFTTCPTICPVMKNNLLKVYNQFENNENVKYLSHTINPDYDNIDSLYYTIRNNEFKRYQSAPVLKINEKSFGVGRRYPIVNNFGG